MMISTVMRYESFEALGALSNEELTNLSKHGDAAERVWAAWTRGLRIGAQFSNDALARLDTEPNSGIRRHLIVMLAGFWAEQNSLKLEVHPSPEAILSIIEAMACFDPDERVRATAWMNWIHVCDLSIDQVTQALGDSSVTVRLVILEAFTNRWSPEKSSILGTMFHDSDPRIRRAALERWIECRPKEEWFTPELISCLSRETQSSLRKRLHVLCRIAQRDDLIPPDQLEASFPLPRSPYLPMLAD